MKPPPSKKSQKPSTECQTEPNPRSRVESVWESAAQTRPFVRRNEAPFPVCCAIVRRCLSARNVPPEYVYARRPPASRKLSPKKIPGKNLEAEVDMSNKV